MLLPYKQAFIIMLALLLSISALTSCSTYIKGSETGMKACDDSFEKYFITGSFEEVVKYAFKNDLFAKLLKTKSSELKCSNTILHGVMIALPRANLESFKVDNAIKMINKAMQIEGLESESLKGLNYIQDYLTYYKKYNPSYYFLGFENTINVKWLEWEAEVMGHKISEARPLFVGHLNGISIPVIIDTGASRSYIGTKLLSRLGAVKLNRKKSPTNISGILGTSKKSGEYIIAQSVKIGEHIFTNIMLDIHKSSDEITNQSLVVGLDALVKIGVIEFDNLKDVIRLSSACSDKKPSTKSRLYILTSEQPYYIENKSNLSIMVDSGSGSTILFKEKLEQPEETKFNTALGEELAKTLVVDNPIDFTSSQLNSFLAEKVVVVEKKNIDYKDGNLGASFIRNAEKVCIDFNKLIMSFN